MAYRKPEVVALGEAIRALEILTVKGTVILECDGWFSSPAYDVDG